jgi:hypothetical protein
MGIFLSLQEGEESSLIAKRFRRSNYLFEVAEPSDFVVNLLGVDRVEPACDRLFDVWANEHSIVRLVRDVAPNVFGTHILTKTADDALNVFNGVRKVNPAAEVARWSVNDVLHNSGQYIEDGKCF